MSDVQPTPPPAAPATEPTPTATTPPPAAPEVPEGALGEAGKKALDTMKAERDAARAEARDAVALRARLAEIEDANLNEVDRAIKKAADDREAAVRGELNASRVGDKIALAAADTFAVPAQAAPLLGDLTRFVVDGEIDGAAITAAVADLLTANPNLAKPDATIPPVPGGPRGAGGPGSLDEQIAEAQAKGDTSKVIALNSQKLAALATGS